MVEMMALKLAELTDFLLEYKSVEKLVLHTVALKVFFLAVGKAFYLAALMVY
jgi:hypothetical protein